MTKRLITLFAVVAIAVVAAGCGSSKSSSNTNTTTAAAISKAEFLKKGNAICKSGGNQINAGAKQLFPNLRRNQKPTTAQLRKFATTVLIPGVQAQINGIKALGAPTGDEAKVKAIEDAAQQALDKGKQDPVALATSKGPFAQANKLAHAYGLKACGGG